MAHEPSATVWGVISRRRLILSAALVLLVVGSALVLESTLRGPGSDRLSGDASGSSDSLHDDHARGEPVASRTAPQDRVLARLTGIAVEKGTIAALTRLKHLGLTNAHVQARGYFYAYKLGKFSYRHYGGASSAVSHCIIGFEAGCYHGVVKAYFDDRQRRSGFSGVCSEIDSRLIRAKCSHGLGHGLGFVFREDLDRAFKYCDLLSAELRRVHCYAGVFMQSNQPMFNRRLWLSDVRVAGTAIEEDPAEVCKRMADRYRGACYHHQAAVMLFGNGGDFANAFKQCERAGRARDVANCYAGVGWAVRGFSGEDAKNGIGHCLRGSVGYRSHCFRGFVAMLFFFNESADKAMAFCSEAPDDVKPGCFQAIGDRVSALRGDTGWMIRECGKASRKLWIAWCRSGARLRRSSES